MSDWKRTIEGEVSARVNYSIYKVDEMTLAYMFLKIWRVQFYSQVIRDGKILPNYACMVPKLLREYKDPEELKRVKKRQGHNIVPLVLRSAFASIIVGNTVTPTFEATHVALGSGNTTPANSDTQLATETLRGTLSNAFAVDNVAYLDKFFSSTEVGGNSYLEAGIFVDGTGSANTWYLLSRILINESMAATETLTVNATITIS